MCLTVHTPPSQHLTGGSEEVTVHTVIKEHTMREGRGRGEEGEGEGRGEEGEGEGRGEEGEE